MRRVRALIVGPESSLNGLMLFLLGLFFLALATGSPFIWFVLFAISLFIMGVAALAHDADDE